MNKKNWKQIISMLFFIILGGVCGLIGAKYILAIDTTETTAFDAVINVIIIILLMYLVMLLEIVIHEAGHLIFGLISGYKFCSFRILGFMWLKEEGKIKFKRLSLAGTAGQCLMTPPDMVNGKFPVGLYNLGGSLMNFITSVIFLSIYLLFDNFQIISEFLLMFVTIGFAFAVMNGVPMRLGMVDNDGYNVLSIRKNIEAFRSFWIQLKVNEQLSQGVRLKDMPKEWFEVPENEDMKNSIVSVMGIFACNRLMDEHNFKEAKILMESILEMDSGIVELHRNLLICDCIYCELLEGEIKVAINLMTKEQQKFIKSMKSFPSVLRTQYIYQLIVEKNIDKSNHYLKEFKKVAKFYPYPCEVESEEELIEYSNKIK